MATGIDRYGHRAIVRGMVDLQNLLRYCALSALDRQDPLGANLALFAGMKRHGLAVRTRFYLSRAHDTGLDRTLGEPGLAIWFAGNIFDAGGRRSLRSIERAAKMRLDAAFDSLPAAYSGGFAIGERHYEFRLMPHTDPAFYHASLSQIDPDWIFRAETGTGLALVPGGSSRRDLPDLPGHY